MAWGGKRPRMRRGKTLLSSSQRRARRKIGGLSGRQQKRVTKKHRAYKRGVLF